MNNTNIKETIKEARLTKGLSQEALSDLSNISLRTIQRIESGIGKPRLFTIKTLAKHLDISISNLTLEKTQDQNLDKEIVLLKKMNMSIILTLIIPLANIIVPLIIWKTSDVVKELKNIGEKIISFQILWTIATLCFFFLSIFISNLINENSGNSLYIAFIIYLISLVLNIIFVLKSSTKLEIRSKNSMGAIPNLL
ncbi:MAG: transcriptional regulator with XRE-family HTH domain [Planctomycetota bacterium]|jgi:transcriptional regulator with XRE-family HTH domain